VIFSLRLVESRHLMSKFLVYRELNHHIWTICGIWWEKVVWYNTHVWLQFYVTFK